MAVVPRADHRSAHPSRALLIIEVADSSLETDLGPKARLYAESGVEEYWVVNVRDAIIEVHSDIVRGAYTRVLPFEHDATISLRAFPDVQIAVGAVV